MEVTGPAGLDIRFDGPPVAGTPDLNARLEAQLHRGGIELPAFLVKGLAATVVPN